MRSPLPGPPLFAFVLIVCSLSRERVTLCCWTDETPSASVTLTEPKPPATTLSAFEIPFSVGLLSNELTPSISFAASLTLPDMLLLAAVVGKPYVWHIGSSTVEVSTTLRDSDGSYEVRFTIK